MASEPAAYQQIRSQGAVRSNAIVTFDSSKLNSGTFVPVGMIFAAAAFMGASIGSTSGVPLLRLDQLPGFGYQQLAVARQEDAESVPSMLVQIRKRTALTWEQLASVLTVTRRALHHWANGNKVSPENDLKVRALMERIEAMQGQPPHVVKARILRAAGTPKVPQQGIENASWKSPILFADQTPLSSPQLPRGRMTMRSKA